MNPPGSKYFKGRFVRGERVLHYVIWDGVQNYQNVPPLLAIALATKMPGVQLHVKVTADDIEDIQHLIAAPLDSPEVGGLVVWTNDHRTYRLIVQLLAKRADAWLT